MQKPAAQREPILPIINRCFSDIPFSVGGQVVLAIGQSANGHILGEAIGCFYSEFTRSGFTAVLLTQTKIFLLLARIQRAVKFLRAMSQFNKIGIAFFVIAKIFRAGGGRFGPQLRVFADAKGRIQTVKITS